MSQNGSVARIEAIWKEAWETTLAEELKRQELTDTSTFKAGGRATKANPNKEDGAWWETNGLNMFKSFTEWWEANNNWHVWLTPAKQPAVEIELFSDFNGVPVRAYADLIGYDQDGVLSVIDFKTGAYMPHSGMQLGLYAVIAEKLFGIRPERGYFYDARSAMMLPAQHMERWTDAVFTELFDQFRRGLEAEIFLPNIGMMCGSCAVKDFCYAYGGQLTWDVDPLSKL